MLSVREEKHNHSGRRKGNVTSKRDRQRKNQEKLHYAVGGDYKKREICLEKDDITADGRAARAASTSEIGMYLTKRHLLEHPNSL